MAAPSTGTAEKSERTSRFPRPVLYALPFLVVIGAVAVIVPKVLDGDEKTPVFSSTTYEVTYEVDGEGTTDAITYSTGKDNTETTVQNVKLPWKKTVQMPVALTGGTANLIARNPSNDTTITCRILVGGVAKNEVQATDGYVDPSCAAPLSAKQGK